MKFVQAPDLGPPFGPVDGLPSPHGIKPAAKPVTDGGIRGARNLTADDEIIRAGFESFGGSCGTFLIAGGRSTRTDARRNEDEVGAGLRAEGDSLARGGDDAIDTSFKGLASHQVYEIADSALISGFEQIVIIEAGENGDGEKLEEGTLTAGMGGAHDLRTAVYGEE